MGPGDGVHYFFASAWPRYPDEEAYFFMQPYRGPLPSNYTVSDALPGGGMGSLHRVLDETGCTYILKELPGGLLPLSRPERFLREMRVLASLEVEGVPKVVAFNDDPQSPYLLMEEVPGVPLADWELPPSVNRVEVVARLALRCLHLLEHVHAAGVVHRDISPRNLLIDGDGRPWLVDFGIATDDGATVLTQTGDMVGTLRYISPEQASGLGHGSVGPTSDLYSLGLVLLELFRGDAIRTGTTRHELLFQAVAKHSPPLTRLLPKLPARLAAFFEALIAQDLRDRYPSAAAARADLETYLQGEAISPPRMPMRRRIRRWWHHAGVLLRTAAAVSLILLAVAPFGAIMWAKRIPNAIVSANGLTAAGDPRGAFELLQEWRDRLPEHAQVEGNWAKHALAAGQSYLSDELAIKHLTRVLDAGVAPHHASRLRLQRAFRYLLAGRGEEAREDLKKAHAQEVYAHIQNLTGPDEQTAQKRRERLRGFADASELLLGWLDCAEGESFDPDNYGWSFEPKKALGESKSGVGPYDRLLKGADSVQEKIGADIDAALWLLAVDHAPTKSAWEFTTGTILEKAPYAAILRRLLIPRLVDYFEFEEATGLVQTLGNSEEAEAYRSYYLALIAHGRGDFTKALEWAEDALADERVRHLDEPTRRKAACIRLVSQLHERRSRQRAVEEWHRLLRFEESRSPKEIALLLEASSLLGKRDDPQVRDLLDSPAWNAIDFGSRVFTRELNRIRWSPPLRPAAGDTLPSWAEALQRESWSPTEVIRISSEEDGSLGKAIREAPDGATIELEPGDYTVSEVLVGRRLRIVGLADGLDGGSADRCRLLPSPDRAHFEVRERGALLWLENLTLEGGSGVETSAGSVEGGAVWINSGSLVLVNCRLIRNKNKRIDRGGAVSVSQGQLLALSCEITENYAKDVGGAVIASRGSKVALNGCTITGNRVGARSGSQDCVGLWRGVTLWANDCRVSGGNRGIPFGGVASGLRVDGGLSIEVRNSVLLGGWYGPGNRALDPRPR